MTHCIRLLLLGGALFCGSQPSSAQGALKVFDFSPKPVAGEVWHRDFQAKHLLGLDSLVRQEGDLPPQRIQIRTRLSADNRLRYVDRLAEVEGGRIHRFQREIKESQVVANQDHLQEGAPPNEVALKGGIESLHMVYTWAPAEGQYGRYYEGVEARESWLASLPADLPCEVLLPPGPVALNQTWTIDPMLLRGVLAPGGAPRYQMKKGTDRVLTRTLQMGVAGSLFHGIRGQASGKVTARFVAVRDGVAQVAVTVEDVRYLADITDFSRDNRLKREEQVGIDSTTGKQLVELTGAGTLFWDLDAGRMNSFRFGGREVFRTEIQVTGMGGTYVETVQLSGRLEVVFSNTLGASSASDSSK
ncbi:MAG TPA: hypothetical protein EYQ74_01330 [Planctomycetes bacterium]|nr:hypothetical protein [Planctomycetota bacterium]HIK62367.1 hypothetical protein [Planctomycetota bacterium]